MNLEQRIKRLEENIGIGLTEGASLKSLLRNQVKFLTSLASVTYRGKNYSFEILDFSNYELELLYKDDLYVKIQKSIKGQFQDNFGRPGEKKQLVSISYQTVDSLNTRGHRYEDYSICDPWDLPQKISNLIERYY